MEANITVQGTDVVTGNATTKLLLLMRQIVLILFRCSPYLLR